MYSVLSRDPSKFYKAARAAKNPGNDTIKKLLVDNKVYEGDQVCDGFFDSISFLKTAAHQDLDSSPVFVSANEEYRHILRISQQGSKIPNITREKTKQLLASIRPAVSDFASITANHFHYAGDEGVSHLKDLINGIIDDLNNLSVDELNIVSACIHHKGHGKKKTSADSYRTISSCPFQSKLLDSYIRDIYGHVWDHHQADTQFQGAGSSHEHAALLLTECIQHSLHTKKPLFVLYLDAKSAFDLVLRQFLINKLFHYGIQDHGLVFLDQRLKHRKTVCEWNGQLMGPILDKWGVEQGGRNSSELYKVFNNCQLEIAQSSKLGVALGACLVAYSVEELDVVYFT